MEYCEKKGQSVLSLMLSKGVDMDCPQGSTSTSSSSVSFEQPVLINSDYKLKDYQLTGVAWLCCLYEKGFGGILAGKFLMVIHLHFHNFPTSPLHKSADEMGLGKTAQIISFLASIKQKASPISVNPQAHLIIVPSSVLDNWLQEFQSWCPSLEVEAYHGSAAERANFRGNYDKRSRIDFDVLVTTYNIASSNKEDRNFLKKLGFKTLILGT